MAFPFQQHTSVLVRSCFASFKLTFKKLFISKFVGQSKWLFCRQYSLLLYFFLVRKNKILLIKCGVVFVL